MGCSAVPAPAAPPSKLVNLSVSPKKSHSDAFKAPVVNNGAAGAAALALGPAPLDESTQLLAADVEWLDEDEMRAQEDEDERLTRAVNASEEDLEAWLARQESLTARRGRIAITEYVLSKKSMGRKTIEYVLSVGGPWDPRTGGVPLADGVEVSPEIITVKRSYRDFLALRAGFCARFPGAIVPPLPKKKIMGKTDPVFVARRKELLEHFLHAVARHPYLAAEEMFNDFLVKTSPFNRQSAQSSRSRLFKLNLLSDASKRWAQLLIQTPSVSDPVAVIDSALVELDAIKRHFVFLRDILDAQETRILGHAQASEDLATAMQTSAGVENRLILLTATRVPQALADPNTPVTDAQLAVPSTPGAAEMGRLFSEGRIAESAHGKILVEEAERSYKAMGAAIRYELLFVECMVGAVHSARTATAKHRASVKMYRDAKDAPDSFASKQHLILTAQQQPELEESPDDLPLVDAERRAIPAQSTGEMDRARRRLAKLRSNAVAAQRDARREMTGKLQIELGRFRTERVARVSQALTRLANMRMEECQRVMDVWRGIEFDAPVDRLTSWRSGTRAHNASADPIPLPSSAARNPFAPAAPMVVSNEGGSMKKILHPTEEPVLANNHNNNSNLSYNEEEHEQHSTVRTTRRLSQLRATYAFKADNDDEMDLEPGDVLEGEIDEADPNWFRAKDLATGRTGLVPVNHVEVLPDGEDDEDYELEEGEEGHGEELQERIANGESAIRATQQMMHPKNGSKHALSLV